MQVGVGPQQREIGTPISTGNASWGGAPTQRISKKKFYRQCKLAGTQHREFQKKKFYRQCRLAWPQHREFQKKKFYRQCRLAWPQHREFQKMKFYRQCRLAGPQHREFQKRNSTGSAGWGTTIKKYFFFITLCPTHFPKY